MTQVLTKNKTVISWINHNLEGCENPKVESIIKYQAILESMEQNVTEGGREWIGTIEVGYVIDLLFNTPCRIINCPSRDNLNAYFGEIKDHFEKGGSPLMLGGGRDYGSKGIFGISKNHNGELMLLIVDPHYIPNGPMKMENFVYWRGVSDLGMVFSLVRGVLILFVLDFKVKKPLKEDGFYNVLMPKNYKLKN